MIGQQQLLSKLRELNDNGKFPRFLILIGRPGSEQSDVANELTNILGNATIESYGSRVDDIREMISDAYKHVGGRYVYVIECADAMSVAAKNAMLKVTEEPPNNANFIFFVENEGNLLDTIKSRAIILQMDSYTGKQLLDYAKSNYGDGRLEYAKICDTPGDVDLLHSYGVDEVVSYVNKVVHNIHLVSGSNSFKIGSRIDLGNDDGIDLGLFWRCFMENCHEIMDDNPSQYVDGIIVTCKYYKELGINGINKQMLFDNWLLDIRSRWLRYAED